ncbi:MAG: hypothetical protein JSR81_12180 [Proteobacteria bacterium]|nr:hypothetical protein [Pseudomonadota bacterium]
MRIMSFLAAATLLLLAGCYPPTTTHPVGTTAGLSNDAALTGLWRGKMHNDEGHDIYFHFLPQSDGTITVVMVQGGSEPDGDWSVAAVTTATLGANHFMNAQLLYDGGSAEDKNAPHGNVPLLYRMDGPNRIALFLMDEDAAKAAIQAHDISGTVEPGQFGDAAITAEPKELDAFMASRKGIALFGERFATLTKIE